MVQINGKTGLQKVRSRRRGNKKTLSYIEKYVDHSGTQCMLPKRNTGTGRGEQLEEESQKEYEGRTTGR
jgi:hypothetical protein